MKALGLVVSDKKIFENCILKTYFLTLWPTYATNWNNLNNFGRGPLRDHSCEVWSKSNERFQRRRCLSKKVYGRRTTHAARRTTDDDGPRPITIAHPKHFVLRWAKKTKRLISITFNFGMSSPVPNSKVTQTGRVGSGLHRNHAVQSLNNTQPALHSFRYSLLSLITLSKICTKYYCIIVEATFFV